MADRPFLAIAVAEESFRRQKEEPPAFAPERRVRPIRLAQNRIDLRAVGVEVSQPVGRRPLVMETAPAPFVFDSEEIVEISDKPVARHDAAGEEMLRDPVRFVGMIEAIGLVAMGEDVDEDVPLSTSKSAGRACPRESSPCRSTGGRTDVSVPTDLRYTKDHEWVRVDGDEATVGITAYAADQLGDIVFVELPDAGRALDQFAAFGVVESVKAVSDLFAPVSGEVLEAQRRAGRPARARQQRSPYEDGWMVRVRVADAAQLDDLLDADAYDALIAAG